MSDDYLNQILAKLKEDKVLDSTVEYLYMLKMVRDIWLNDELVKDIGSLMDSILALVPVIEKLSELLSNPEVQKVINALASEETIKAIQNPEKVGLTRLMTELRNEDFQRGLGVLVSLIKTIGKATRQ